MNWEVIERAMRIMEEEFVKKLHDEGWKMLMDEQFRDIEPEWPEDKDTKIVTRSRFDARVD